MRNKVKAAKQNPFDVDQEQITLYRVPTGATIPAGWRYAIGYGKSTLATSVADSAYPTIERESGVIYWTFKPLPHPLLPTRLGAVIRNVVTTEGNKYPVAVLLDTLDKLPWYTFFRTPLGTSLDVWLRRSDIATCEIVFEGIDA